MNDRSTSRLALLTAAALLAAGPAGADGAAPEGRSIAYLITNLSWALQSTPEMAECPRGLNDGVREQFKLLFPEVDGRPREFADTQLRRQIESYHPTTAPDELPFLEGEGPVAPGLDLDGMRGPEDFSGPDGTHGVDNQMHRVLGCIANYRAPDGPIRFFEDEMILRENYNRLIVQLNGVDSLLDDPEVVMEGVPSERPGGGAMEDMVLDVIEGTIESIPPKRRNDVEMVREAVRRAVRASVDQVWGKKSVVRVMVSMLDVKA